MWPAANSTSNPEAIRYSAVAVIVTLRQTVWSGTAARARLGLPTERHEHYEHDCEGNDHNHLQVHEDLSVVVGRRAASKLGVEAVASKTAYAFMKRCWRSSMPRTTVTASRAAMIPITSTAMPMTVTLMSSGRVFASRERDATSRPANPEMR